MNRILILTSDRNEPGTEHERMLAVDHDLIEYEFHYYAMLGPSSSIDYLIDLVKSFKPDYILVHTGVRFRMNPSLIIRELVYAVEKHHNIRVGFQGGREFALKIIKREYEPFGRFGIRSDMVDEEVLFLFETSEIFAETSEMRGLVEKISPYL